MVIFPQGPPGFVLAGVGIEFPYDNALRRGLEGQRDEDPQQIGPFLHDEARVDFPDGLEEHLAILAGMPKAIEGGADGIVEIAIARGKLIPKEVEQGKIDRVGAMRIGGMDRGLDVGRIVQQYIKHVVTLMFVDPDDLGRDWDMVGHQTIGDHAFVQPEVFGGIACIGRGETRFELLAITTGVQCVTEVILPEEGQRGDGITDAVIGLAEHFEPEKALRGGGECLVAGRVSDVHLTILHAMPVPSSEGT